VPSLGGLLLTSLFYRSDIFRLEVRKHLGEFDKQCVTFFTFCSAIGYKYHVINYDNNNVLNIMLYFRCNGRRKTICAKVFRE